MQRRGGYILHIDGTCEGGSPILFAGLDELSGVVLESVKMPSEHADTLIPFLTGIRDRYGVPLGLVHGPRHGPGNTRGRGCCVSGGGRLHLPFSLPARPWERPVVAGQELP